MSDPFDDEPTLGADSDVLAEIREIAARRRQEASARQSSQSGVDELEDVTLAAEEDALAEIRRDVRAAKAEVQDEAVGEDRSPAPEVAVQAASIPPPEEPKPAMPDPPQVSPAPTAGPATLDRDSDSAFTVARQDLPMLDRPQVTRASGAWSPPPGAPPEPLAAKGRRLVMSSSRVQMIAAVVLISMVVLLMVLR